MMTRIALAIGLFLMAGVSCYGQIAGSLQIPKKQHLTGEPVLAVVTITNHSGRDLVFQSDGRFQWLNFIVKKGSGNEVQAKNNDIFGPIKIQAGQTLAREVDLSRYFQLGDPGNFSVSAVIQQPGASAGASTNRVFFNQSPGRLYWNQKVGISGSSGNTREFRLLHFSGDSKTQIYAQVVDGLTGQFVRTFLLGDVLLLRKPLVTVDRQQRMHVVFLATPSMWVHCVIDTDGRLVTRQIHQSPPQGDPQVLTAPDGTVQVSNSIPYDAKASQEKRNSIRKASDRPPIPY